MKAKGVMFIKIDQELFASDMTMENFIRPIFINIHDEDKFVTKDISRMIPVERACLASIDNFELYMPDLITANFSETEENKTWCLLYKCRNNSKFFKE